jgi:tetratricopeptide (TPR) repeat protein
LAVSHAALASAYALEWNWPHAEAEFKRALELNPNEATVHASYSSLALFTQRFQEAITDVEWAAALDPLNPTIRLARGLVLLGAGRSNDAIRELRSAMSLAPGVYQFHWVLWRALHVVGNDDEALSEVIALNEAAGDAETASVLRRGGTRGGYQEAMRKTASLREERARNSAPLDPAFLALLEHDAGNDSRAFDWMERALEDGDPNLPTLGILAPDLKNVPRFRSLMQRIGLPY